MTAANSNYTNWCRMPKPEEIEREAAAAAQALMGAETFAVGDRAAYIDHGERRSCVVEAVESGNLGARYVVLVDMFGRTVRVRCSGADLAR